MTNLNLSELPTIPRVSHSLLSQLGLIAVSRFDARDDLLRLSLDIQSDLHWFRGHFPGNPVLPGIVQLHWATQLAAAYFDVSNSPVEIIRLKFKKLIIPPAITELVLTRVDSDIEFEYLSHDQQCSHGVLRYLVRE